MRFPILNYTILQYNSCNFDLFSFNWNYNYVRVNPVCSIFPPCLALQGRTGGVQGNPMMKAGLSCNHYRISLAIGNNSNNFRINLLSSHDFPARPLFILALVHTFSALQCNSFMNINNFFKIKANI